MKTKLPPAPSANESDADAQDRAHAFLVVRSALKGAEARLAEFAKRFAEDPHHAFDWSQSAIEAAATKKVASRALAMLEAHYSVAVVVEELTEVVLRSARYGERSTSPVGNELARCVLAAQAELLNELT